MPIVSFWFPFQIVRDILKASHGGVVPARPWLGLWWACWIIPMLLQPASRTPSLEGEVVTSNLTVNPTIASINAALGVAAFVLWIRIVRAIVHAQDPARPSFGGARAPDPAPLTTDK